MSLLRVPDGTPLERLGGIAKPGEIDNALSVLKAFKRPFVITFPEREDLSSSFVNIRLRT